MIKTQNITIKIISKTPKYKNFQNLNPKSFLIKIKFSEILKIFCNFI